jgi:D-aspartate ligase
MEEVLKHKHIVITGDNGNALGVVRSLAEYGIQPIIIYLQENRFPFLLNSRFCKTKYTVYSYSDGVDLLLDKFGNEDGIPFVYTCDDFIESILDARYEELQGKFYFFNAGGRGCVNAMMDKNRICDMAKSCGLIIPPREVVETGVLPKTLTYPVITKTLMSIMGAWKNDVYICNSEDELQQAYIKIKSPRLLVQEYIKKKNELAIMGFSINGGEQVYMPYQLSYFRTQEYSYGSYMYFKPFDDDRLREKIKKLIRLCNYSGCFEIEFLVDTNEKLYFLEVNFRFSYWNYALTYGGVNYPVAWSSATLSGYIDESKYYLKQYFTAMDEPGDYGQVVATKKMSVKSWIKEMYHTNVLYIYNKKDKMPALKYWSKAVRSMVKYKLMFWRKNG